MERLLYHMYLELLHDFDVALVGPAGCAAHAVGAKFVAECPLSPMWRFFAQCQWHAYRAASWLRPDLIVAGSGVTSPAALIAGHAIDAPVLCYLHGLDIIAKNILYQKLFIPAVRRCDAIVVNSQNTAELARKSGVQHSRISVLPPGVTLPPSQPTTPSHKFRARVGSDRGPILLSVGRLTARKGLVDFVTNVMARLVPQHPELVLAIIGSEPAQALHRSRGERQRILEAAHRVGIARNVALLGLVDDETLHAAYSASDLLVFPVKDLPGDVEGFGMVAIEAAAHGLPTVAFAAGGVPDAIKPGVSGYLVEPGDYVGFAKRISAYLGREDRDVWRSRCIEFAEAFSWEKFGARWRRICHEMISGSTSQ